MTVRNDGGPAFPTPCDAYGDHSPSMSLRDWFAGQALSCLLEADANVGGNSYRQIWDNLARTSYAIADAMLMAREEQP